MKPSKEKMEALAALRTRFAESFRVIEARATAALADAGSIGAGDPNLEAAVVSNKGFLVWVAKFVEKQ